MLNPFTKPKDFSLHEAARALSMTSRDFAIGVREGLLPKAISNAELALPFQRWSASEIREFAKQHPGFELPTSPTPPVTQDKPDLGPPISFKEASALFGCAPARIAALIDQTRIPRVRNGQQVMDSVFVGRLYSLAVQTHPAAVPRIAQWLHARNCSVLEDWLRL